jgi:hypothetical protein
MKKKLRKKMLIWRLQSISNPKKREKRVGQSDLFMIWGDDLFVPRVFSTA